MALVRATVVAIIPNEFSAAARRILGVVSTPLRSAFIPVMFW